MKVKPYSRNRLGAFVHMLTCFVVCQHAERVDIFNTPRVDTRPTRVNTHSSTHPRVESQIPTMKRLESARPKGEAPIETGWRAQPQHQLVQGGPRVPPRPGVDVERLLAVDAGERGPG